MKKPKTVKEVKKKRSAKYEKPLIINGTFADVIKVAVRDEHLKPNQKK